MSSKLSRKYGLVTAICMVVGTVIGSGIFFRNESIIGYTGGNMWIGVAAWLVGGFITLSAAYVFGVLATRHERVGGLVDFAEALLGKRFAYLFGWFLATMFYPTMTGILAWVSARFTIELFGWHQTYGINQFFSGETYALALFYLVAIYAVNVLSQKLSGKVQVSTTVIKLIPLLVMGIVGTIAGLANGTTLENLRSDYVAEATSNPFFFALLATVFAYMGWDSVLALNSEIKNSKRNLPIALVSGLLIIMTVYALYFLGIFSAGPLQVIGGSGGVLGAFSGVFGGAAGTVLFAFIVISCLGTLNGLSVAGVRAFYIMAARGQGAKPKVFSQVDKVTDIPNNSAAIFLVFVAFWMLVFSGNQAGWYGDFVLDLPGMVPVFFQFFLIPMFLLVLPKEKKLGGFNRFVAPLIALAGSSFLIYAAFYSQGTRVFVFGGIFAVFMIAGALFYKKTAK